MSPRWPSASASSTIAVFVPGHDRDLALGVELGAVDGRGSARRSPRAAAAARGTARSRGRPAAPPPRAAPRRRAAAGRPRGCRARGRARGGPPSRRGGGDAPEQRRRSTAAAAARAGPDAVARATHGAIVRGRAAGDRPFGRSVRAARRPHPCPGVAAVTHSRHERIRTTSGLLRAAPPPARGRAGRAPPRHDHRRRRAGRSAPAAAQTRRAPEHRGGRRRDARAARSHGRVRASRPRRVADPVPPPREFELPPEREPFDFSRLLGARTLALTGGIVSLLGIVFFFALAVQRGWIGPVARVSLGALASGAMLGAGWWLRRRFGETLARRPPRASAIAGAYATLLAAAARYDLVSDPAALVLAARHRRARDRDRARLERPAARGPRPRRRDPRAARRRRPRRRLATAGVAFARADARGRDRRVAVPRLVSAARRRDRACAGGPGRRAAARRLRARGRGARARDGALGARARNRRRRDAAPRR